MKTAKAVRFRFPSVLTDALSGVAVDKYLGAARLDASARQHAKELNAGDLYLVTLGAKTHRFEVDIVGDNDGGGGVNIPEIQQVIGGSVKVSAGAGAGSAVAYEGSTPVYFGFQAIRLYFRDGTYQGFKPLLAGKGTMLGGEARERTWLESSTPLLNLKPHAS
jgi:hypothetical protein